MTEENLAEHADSEWQPFWRNLKEAHDVFERTRMPPLVSVCDKKYVVSDGSQLQRADCTDTHIDIDVSANASGTAAKATKARKVVSKTQKRRAAGRNVRKNYAEARKARMAAHAERARAKQASASKKRTQ
jgi:murein L,D-transpeptidase YafK